FDSVEKNYLRKLKAFSLCENLQIVTPSKWLYGIIKNSFLSDKKVCVINNGINIETFNCYESDFRQKYDLLEKKLILGVSYWWVKDKGVDFFNKLACDLPDEYKIVLVGQKRVDLNEKILLIPKTENQNELAKIYSACDIFVNPSLFENYPTVNLEALSCGLPVITFSTGGSGEMINSFNGHVVSKGDYNALKKAILDLTGSFDREKIKQDANRFSNKIFCEKYYRLYNEQK
ncbi:MAG TPA: glycosyl transferase, partial [Clostridiales bacterium]|nr:glycosyl transferase [Clostridiales bacterium]